jgi:hypothetical protein
LPVVLYGHEAWSLTLKEEQRLRVLEIRVLREIFKPNTTKEWKKLHYDELLGMFCSPYCLQVITLRGMSWVGHAAYRGERRGVYRV